MHVQTLDQSLVNRRGGQESFLLLTRGQFGSRNLSITWVNCAPGSEQAVHSHRHNEQVYVIVGGTGLMIVGDEYREVQAGMLVFVPARTGHAIRNTGNEPLVYVSATSPPFDPAELDAPFQYQAQG